MFGKEASDDLALRLASLKRLKLTGVGQKNHSIAENILDEELGRFRDSLQSSYDLTETVRDRLVVHSRRDAAQALLNTISLLDEIQSLRKQVSTSVSLNWLALGGLFLVGWKLFH